MFSRSLPQQRARAAWFYLAPTLLVLFLVAAWPLGRTFFFSFTDVNLNDMSTYKWVGLENYFGEFGLFFNPSETDGFWASSWGIAISNTLFFSVISVTLETILGLIVALILNQEFPGRGWVRAAVLIPWAIPTIVSAKMWGWMLNDQYGVVNGLINTLGITSEKIAWTADPDLALWSVIAVDVWKTTPFMALLTLAALQILPKDIYEAARVDGIHPLKVFFRITLPLIRPALMVAVLFRLLDALRVFDLIYVLTSNSENTISMSGFVRREMMDNGLVGFGSAASFVLFLIISVCSLFYIRFSRVRGE